MKAIALEDRVPLRQKIAYAAGAPLDWFSVGLATAALWMPVWNIAYISPAVLGIVLLILIAILVPAMWLIVPSMQADIVDYDEQRSHKGREGSINSIFSWFLKMAFTFSAGVSGFVIEATGFDVSLGSEQPESVLTRMLLFFDSADLLGNIRPDDLDLPAQP